MELRLAPKPLRAALAGFGVGGCREGGVGFASLRAALREGEGEGESAAR
jgi:hypothetical protein